MTYSISTYAVLDIKRVFISVVIYLWQTQNKTVQLNDSEI